MDIGFEILIPCTTELTEIRFQSVIYEWQGVQYPQNEEQAWYQYFKVIKSSVPEHIKSFLPTNLQTVQWQCLAIIEGLEILVEELRIQPPNLGTSKNGLFGLLNALLKNQKKWTLVFEPGYDRIDETLNGDINTAYNKIISSLIVQEEGFIIWHSD